MQLILVRHPQPAVAAGLCYGSSDLPAADGAIDAAVKVLSVHALDGLPVYASPLARCADLARRLSPAPLLDARLAEMHFGAWEMRSWDDIPREEVDAWSADLLHYRPGGGESVMDVATRIAAFHEDLRKQSVDRALIVCHAGTIRLLSSMHQGGSLEEAALRAARTPQHIAYAEVTMLKA